MIFSLTKRAMQFCLRTSEKKTFLTSRYSEGELKHKPSGWAAASVTRWRGAPRSVVVTVTASVWLGGLESLRLQVRKTFRKTCDDNTDDDSSSLTFLKHLCISITYTTTTSETTSLWRVSPPLLKLNKDTSTRTSRRVCDHIRHFSGLILTSLTHDASQG